MSSQNLNARDVVMNVSKKLALRDFKGTREQHGDFYLDGKYQFQVTLPNVHGGSGAVSTGWLKVCRESVYLNAREYADLVRCPMTDKDYERIIRDRIASR